MSNTETEGTCSPGTFGSSRAGSRDGKEPRGTLGIGVAGREGC